MRLITFALMTLCAMPLMVMAQAGADLITKCESCHGENGQSKYPDVPIIAGFSYDGFLETMIAFQDFDRVSIEFALPDQPKTTMNDIAGSLQTAQVEALAAYFSEKPFKAATQPFEQKFALIGAALHENNCEKCHSDKGSSTEEDTPILAGQWMDYLSQQFIHMDAGDRIVPKKMARRIKKLSAEDKQALLHFYASRGQ